MKRPLILLTLELGAVKHVEFHNRRKVLHGCQVGDSVQVQFPQSMPLVVGEPRWKTPQLAVFYVESLQIRHGYDGFRIPLLLLTTIVVPIPLLPLT